jgi:pimeloyl-ACP methyl ester carboxylesterase
MAFAIPRSPAVILGLLICVWAAFPRSIYAQEVCGNGTTFTVSLPSISGGNGDSLTLPHGCRIYALFVSGYARNPQLDELTFYKAAKFITENNGYVHWAWWNNILKPYMAKPAHYDETFTIPIIGTVLHQSPGSLPGSHAAGFVPAVHELAIVPKGVPEEDFQFQADARKMLARIREQNPDALIVVAGHSMGGNSVARLGATTPTDIDLLAPIDPVGNRSSPIGRPTVADPRPDRTFNWTRWRASHEFAGFKVRDCVRNVILLCQNFGTILHPEFHCTTVGAMLTSPPPLPGSLSPLLCPGPWIDPGKPLKFGGRIKRLYHRWQNETLFPFDYLTNEIYSHWAPRNAGGPTVALNFQMAVGTCLIGFDPRDPARLCNPTDGHGEVVGFRTPTPGQPNPPGPNIPVAPLANQALAWPLWDETHSVIAQNALAGQRRALLLEMPTADDSWSHRPIDPNLDLVVDDMVGILKNLLAAQPAVSSPTTVATPTPGPNEHGWNNENVVVNLSATVGPGRTITAITYSLSGAQAGTTVHEGDTVDVPISAEGTTTITFFSKDDLGQVEEPQTLTLKIDKTPPSITGTPNPAPNANGWYRTDVTVTFTASDALSGVASIDSPLTITGEGAGLQATGSATDLAGNTSATVVTVNIDRTAPLISGLPDPACSLWPPNQKLVEVATVMASDGLSGVTPGSLAVNGSSSEAQGGKGPATRSADIVITEGVVQVRADRDGRGVGRTYTVIASASDLAGNVVKASGSCFVRHDQGKK